MTISRFISRVTVPKLVFILMIAILIPAAGSAKRIKPLADHEREIIAVVRDHILNGEYDTARKKLFKYEKDHPSNPLASLGLMLTYQAQMLENLNFAYQKDYEVAYERNQKLTKNYADSYDDDPWHAILRGATYGVQGIFLTRRKEWMSAFSNGLKGMITLDKVTRNHPELVDARLGEGILKFWRGAMARQLSLPGVFADDKTQGLAVLDLVAEKAELVGPAARLAKVYALYFEKDYAAALTTISLFLNKYPKSYVGRLMKSRCYYKLKQYSLAENELKSLRKDYPKNPTALYHLGYVAYLRNNNNQAREYLEQFVKADVEAKWLALGNYRLGRVYEDLRKYDPAIASYKKALKYDSDYDSAKSRLKRAEEKKKKAAARASDAEKRDEKRKAAMRELRERLRKAREQRKAKQKGEAYKKSPASPAPRPVTP